MKMCTLVVYRGPLSFSRVMPVWTWKFDTIHCALCHHNSSHMLNEMFGPISKPYFVKKSSNGEFLCLNAHNCTLESKDVQVHSFGHNSQDPNMKMCTLAGYTSPLRFTPVMLFWT
jgi:hypothetical protein